MYYARIFLVALLGGVLLAGPALATRTTSAAFLKIGVGARAAGMGEAYVAQAQDASGLYWNPAGLARLDRKQFIFMHNDWFENINYEYLGYVHPLAGTALFGRTWDGALGGSLTYVDKGDLQRTTYSNPFGAGLGSFEAQDFAGAVSYAESYNDQLDLGGTLKLVYQEIDDVTATSVAVDFGAQYRGAYPGLTLGAALTNLGTKAKFEREDEDLPLAFRFGAAYEVPQFPLTVATDGVWLYDDEVSWRVGVEYDLNQYLALRAGYNSANDADDGFGGGFGITIDDLEINYAYVPYGDLGNTHRIDSVFRFGEIVPRPEPQAPPVTTRPQPPVTTRPQPPVTQRPEPPVTTTPASAEQQVRILIAQGNQTLAAGDARGAVQAYLDALKLDPRSYAAYYNLGNASFALRNYAAARDAFTYALQLKPGMLPAMSNLGGALYKLQDYAGAAKLWEAVLQREPGNTQARHNLDVLYQKHPEAREAARGAVPSVPDALLAPLAPAAAAAPAVVPTPEPAATPAAAPAINVPPPTVRAVVPPVAVTPVPTPVPTAAPAAPAVAPAAEPTATAVAAQPAAAVAPVATANPAAAQLVTRGNELAKAGQFTEAIVAYQQALTYDPRSFSAYFNLGNAAYALHDFAAARTAYETALQLKPENLETMNNLGGALYKLKQFTMAARLWEKVLLADPSNAAVRANLDKVYERHPESRPQQ